MQLPHISRLSLPDVSEAISGPMGERSERTQPDASEAITLSTPLGPDRVAILHAVPRVPRALVTTARRTNPVQAALLITHAVSAHLAPVAARRERSDQRPDGRAERAHPARCKRSDH